MAPGAASRAAQKAAPASWLLHAPWTDKKGRLHPLRTLVLVLLALPAVVLVSTWLTTGLGARPIRTAIHSTGYWSVWFLLASLAVTPWKALSGDPGVAVVRRMVGIASLAYALGHLVLYMADENWRLLHIGQEIVLRVYLLIGAVALAGLCVLGATSTDAAIRRMGKRWKSLHKLAYGIAVLTAVHFVLQSKADVSQAIVASGVFAWLMLWRQLPAGPDRSPPVLAGLAVAASLAAAATEFLWYRFGTKIDPVRVLWAELDVSWGLRPAALVLAIGLLVAALVALKRVAEGPWGVRAGFTAAVFALGAVADDALSWAFGLFAADPAWMATLAAAPALALLGWVRHRMGEGWMRRGVDGLWLASIAAPLLLDDAWPVAAGFGVLAAGAAVALLRLPAPGRVAAE